MVMYLRSLLARLHKEELAQDAFEYLLVIGGISVAIILAMTIVGWDTMVGAVIDGVCAAIDGIPGFTMGDCTP